MFSARYVLNSLGNHSLASRHAFALDTGDTRNAEKLQEDEKHICRTMYIVRKHL